MKTFFKHFLATAVLLLVSVSMNAEVYSGDCGADGDNVKWELDMETGVLSITGSGEMMNYSQYRTENIPWYSFSSSIIKVIIENGVTSIGDYAFMNLSNLSSINIPESVARIGTGAFSNCSSLPIEDNLRYADTYLVGAVDKTLSTYNIKEGTRFIGNHAFNSCSKLTSITIPESVTSIGSDAFVECSGLISINIPEGVTSIGSGAFFMCSGLISINIPEGVTSIAGNTFSFCSGLTSITIPGSVTSIGYSAFSFCSGLTSITIPESVKSIGESAFNRCSGLTSINIPEGVTSIGSYAFVECSGLISIAISEGVTSIGDFAFAGCSGLTSINISEGVTSIGESAFKNCSGLISINIPESVTYIGRSAFEGCSRINKPTYNSKFFVRLPVSYQGEYAIPETIETICDYAFRGCSGLTSIYIPESVTSIGYRAFYQCFIPTSGYGSIYRATSIIINGKINYMPDNTFRDVYPKYIEINNNMTTTLVPGWNLSNLSEVKIGDKVTILYNGMFTGCRDLRKVTLGKSLQYIRNDNFSGCPNLNSVICHSEEPPLCYPGVFSGADLSKSTLTVPMGCKEKYVGTEPWSKFGKIIEADYGEEPEITKPEQNDDGYYMISNAQDLIWFSNYVNRGANNVNAILTADIDLRTNTGLGEFVPIGTTYNQYNGVFDGQGHAVFINMESNKPFAALFAEVGTAQISNLSVKGTIVTSAQFAAALIGRVNGNGNHLCNIETDVTIISTAYGDGTHGGILSVADGSVNMINCIAIGNMESDVTSHCGGLIGWTNAPIKMKNCAYLGALNVIPSGCNILARNSALCELDNCYYLNECNEIPGTAIQTYSDAVKDGELAYKLNGNQTEIGYWQTIGTDATPTPIRGKSLQVFAFPEDGFRCDGKPLGNTKYTNSDNIPSIPSHTYNGAFCDVCDTFKPDFLTPNVDGFYEISTGEDLAWFSHKVALNENGNCNATLIEDIKMDEISNRRFIPIGNRSNGFCGIFDGLRHVISDLIIDNDLGDQGLIGVAKGGAIIKNVVLDNTCSIKCNAFAAGIVGCAYGAGTVTIENCGNEANITTKNENAAGILGVNYDSQTDLVIKNCYNTGKITGGKESAGISGWLGWQTASAIVENCYNTGLVTGVDNNQTFARFGTSTGVIKLSNCYETIDSQVTYISSKEVASGKLCYLLNGSQSENPIWYQTLEKDNHPVFDQAHGIVYYNKANNLYSNQAFNGIAEIMADRNVAGIYSIDGKRLSRPLRGLNIIRMKDDTVKRVMVK